MKNAYAIWEAYENSKKQGLTASELLIQDDLIEICEKEGVSALIMVISEISDSFYLNQDAEFFLTRLVNILAAEGYYFDEQIGVLAEKLSDKFPDSILIITILGDIYGTIINQSRSDYYIRKLEKLSKQYPNIAAVALQQAYTLMYSYRKKEIEDYSIAVEDIKYLYEKHLQPKFAIVYANGLKNLADKQSEKDAVITLDILEKLMNGWDEPIIASAYLDALCKFTRKQDQYGCAETINKMETLWDNCKYQHSDLAMNLAYSLANYSLCFEGQEKQLILDRIDGLSEHWIPAKRIADELKNGIASYAHKPVKAK